MSQMNRCKKKKEEKKIVFVRINLEKMGFRLRIACTEDFEESNEFGHEEIDDEIPEISCGWSFGNKNSPEKNEYDGIECPTDISQIIQMSLGIVQTMDIFI